MRKACFSAMLAGLIATNPDWAGGDQLRYPKIEGNRLTIRTPPLPTRPDGKLRVSILIWERVE